MKASNAVKKLPHFEGCLEQGGCLVLLFGVSFSHEKEERERGVVVKKKYL